MGAQDFVVDPRNAHVLVYLNGELVPRERATVSLFDSGFLLGDGLWEGLRLHRGTLLFLDQHLDRLYDGAKAIDLDIKLSRDELKDAVWKTVRANGMSDGVHIRLMVTRGLKRGVNQDPRHALGQPTLAIVAEYKLPNPETLRAGLSLFTSTIRCMPPDTLDTKLNSHSRLGLIQALIQAIKAGADEALMLDPAGFVCTCNSTNFFFVKRGALHSSTGRYGFNGITRGHVIELCRAHGIPVRLGDYTLSDVYAADEAFVTGTFGGLTPVRAVDGRRLGGALPGPLTARAIELYRGLMDDAGAQGQAAQHGS